MIQKGENMDQQNVQKVIPVRPTLTLLSLKTTSMSFCFNGRPACRIIVTSSLVWLQRTTETHSWHSYKVKY